MRPDILGARPGSRSASQWRHSRQLNQPGQVGAGEANPWTVTYDGALIITKGAFTELVYVAHPHWFEATQRSPHAAKLAEFHPHPHAPSL